MALPQPKPALPKSKEAGPEHPILPPQVEPPQQGRTFLFCVKFVLSAYSPSGGRLPQTSVSKPLHGTDLDDGKVPHDVLDRFGTQTFDHNSDTSELQTHTQGTLHSRKRSKLTQSPYLLTRKDDLKTHSKAATSAAKVKLNVTTTLLTYLFGEKRTLGTLPK